jgi:hypothetical protein
MMGPRVAAGGSGNRLGPYTANELDVWKGEGVLLDVCSGGAVRLSRAGLLNGEPWKRPPRGENETRRSTRRGKDRRGIDGLTR